MEPTIAINFPFDSTKVIVVEHILLSFSQFLTRFIDETLIYHRISRFAPEYILCFDINIRQLRHNNTR